MHAMSYWTIIISWCIVLHTLCKRNILLYSRIYVHIMPGRDLCWCDWIVQVQEVYERIIIISWRIVVHTLCERILLP